ncbi:uncharacterized protein LOC126824621 [Patella vulgata]|uniref:uncharacterized protein LOC126824621 n=1 Tax=Patella vulgata TaxID=6465 RepID=UPI00217F2F59|nr:uncharacterized protein LOC126824621 [Patella vulgata]
MKLKHAIVIIPVLVIIIFISALTNQLRSNRVVRRMMKTVGLIQTLPENNKSCEQIHVICTMPLLTSNDIKTTSYSRYKPENIQARMSEFMTGLQRTLDHQCVYRVHFLYNQSAVVEYVKLNLESNLHKLVFHLVPNPQTQTAYFDFAYDNLQGEIAMYTPSDVYPGEGFELIKKDVMVKNKLMYILTRHGKKEKYCDMRKELSSNSCDEKRYMGSHDTYIFVPIGKFPAEVKKELSVFAIHYGVENMSIWAFRTLGHYKVTNPCKVLKVYHLHCTGLRDARRKRLNTSKNTGMAIPTDHLD